MPLRASQTRCRVGQYRLVASRLLAARTGSRRRAWRLVDIMVPNRQAQPDQPRLEFIAYEF